MNDLQAEAQPLCWLVNDKEMLMNIEAGVWVDHRQAFIVLVSGGSEQVKHVKSGVGKHVRFSGRTAADNGSADDQRDRKFALNLGKYYDDVMAHLDGAQHILLFGPGEAKGELEKRLAAKGSGARIVGVETNDKMTEPQIVAKVRQHFKHPAQ